MHIVQTTYCYTQLNFSLLGSTKGASIYRNFIDKMRAQRKMTIIKMLFNQILIYYNRNENFLSLNSFFIACFFFSYCKLFYFIEIQIFHLNKLVYSSILIAIESLFRIYFLIHLITEKYIAGQRFFTCFYQSHEICYE